MYFDYTPYGLHTAGEPYSFNQIGDTYRFEVHSGDKGREGDTTQERSEMYSKEKLAFDKTYTMSYDFMVEPGELNTVGVNVGQFHGTPDAGDYDALGPVFAVRLVGERMRIVTRTDSDPTTEQRPPDNFLHTDTTDIVRGQWYQMKVDIRFHWDGQGLIDVWRDGQQLVQYTGGVGYNDAVGPYWKMGIYRPAAPEILAVDYRNFNLVEGVAGPPSLGIAATEGVKAEGNAATTAFAFTVTRSGDLSGATTADWAVTGSGASPADAADFGGTLPSGQASFAGGERLKAITVNVASDTVAEADEGFTVTLSNPYDGTAIGIATATGTINDDDGAPSLSIAATRATKAEGNSGTTAFTFTVTRAGDLSGATTADWAVTGSGADPANAADFGAALPTGQVSFAAGENSKVITVDVAGDTVVEVNEGFTVTLSNPSGSAVVSHAAASGAITNDDSSGTSAPSIPDLLASSDTGISDTDNLTKDTTPTFAGTAAAGSTVRLLEGSNQLGQVIAEGTGAWTITASALSAGSHAISATATSPAGVVSPRSGTVTVVIDTTPPTRASRPDLPPESDTGQSSSDNITRDATPSLRGSAQAGSLITLHEGATLIGTAVTDSLGKWSTTTGELSDGVHVLTAQATDAAGNVAPISSPLTLTVDTTTVAPVITSATLTMITGTAEARALVSVFDGATSLGKVTATSSGVWSLSKTLSNSPHTITVTADDRAGNSAAGTGQALLGNSAANSLTGGGGNDRIIGLGGADTLAGGAGDDIFVFGAGFGKDVLNGFVSGPSSEDRIELTKAMLGLASGASAQTAFNTVLAKTADLASDAVITIDSLNTITLTGVSKGGLDLGDFIFT